jgi:hypothetical protein
MINFYILLNKILFLLNAFTSRSLKLINQLLIEHLRNTLTLIYSSLMNFIPTWFSSMLSTLFNEVAVWRHHFELKYTWGNSVTSLKSATFFDILKKNLFFIDYLFFWCHLNTNDFKVTKGFNFNHLRYYSSTKSVTSLQPKSTQNTYMAYYTNHVPQFYFNNVNSSVLYNLSSLISINKFWFSLNDLIARTFSFGFTYIQGFCFILFIDACLTDDEPLWEPIEWSLVQTWILFIFSFAWIAENLIVSRYGSYTGRDKRVWFSWYKSFWLIEGYYVINYGVACVFVILPFYFETNYNLCFVYSWWHWYSRVFFFKFISIFSIVLFISYYLQMTVRWLNWKKGLMLVLLVNIFLSYLIYTQFIMTFFGYFTDPVWYQKTRPIDYIQLSHEPARWGWGTAKKDHFTYHNVKTVLWFKNDGPFAASFIFCQVFLFVCLFLLYIYWITLFRRIYAMKEIPLTFTTYCVSSLKQFFYFFLFFYILIFLSYAINYARYPIEFLWSIDTQSWLSNFMMV